MTSLGGRDPVSQHPRVVIALATPDDREATEALAGTTGVSLDFHGELGRPWARLWLAFPDRGSTGAGRLGSPVIGLLLAWEVADELSILELVTDPGWRRQGVGTGLLRRALEHAAGNHLRLVLLEVRRSNVAALRLYRAAGFSTVRVRRRYYSDGEDAVDMMLTLDPASGAVVPTTDSVPLRSLMDP